MALENKQYLDWTGVQALWKKINAKFATKDSLNGHIKDAVKHITADERTKWNKVDGKADKATTLAGYNIGDAYTKQEVDDAITNKVSALGAVFIFKGQVADMAALKAIVDPKPGDVYHVVTGEKGTHAEYVWVAAQTGGEEAHWEELGTTVDLSGYLTTEVAESTYAKKADVYVKTEVYTKDEVDGKFTATDGRFEGTAANADKAADSDQLGGVAADKYAKLTDVTLKGVKVNGEALTATDKIVDVTVKEGTANGTIKVNGTDISVHGLGSAAYTPSTNYATAAQGAKADTALQEAALEPYAKTADVANTYATKDEVNTLDGAAEKLGNKVDDITKVADEDVTTKYPSVKAVKEAIKNLPTVDEKVKQTAITTGESPILIAGATTSGQSAEANYNDNVKINAATGTLTATAFKGDLTGNVTGNLTGNADSATKATQDGAGAVIADTYAKKTDLEAQMVTAIDVSELEAWLDDPKNN